MSKDAPRTFEALMSQLYAIPKDRHGRHRSDFVYRGLDVATWRLETSLQRLGPHYADVEEPLLRNFIKYSAEPGIASAPLLYKLAVARASWAADPRPRLDDRTEGRPPFRCRRREPLWR